MRMHSLFYYYLKSSTLLLLLTIVTLSGASYLFAENILISTVKDGLQYQADFRKERILTQFSEQKQWMEEVSEDAGLTEFTERLLISYQSIGQESASYQMLQKRFRHEYQGLLNSQGVEDLFLLTPEGKLIFSLRPMEHEIGGVITADGFFGETILSELFEEVTSERRFSVSLFGKIELVEDSTVLTAIPLFSSFGGEEDKMVGVLVRPFPLDRIRQLLNSYSGLGETGEVVIAQLRADGVKTGVNFVSHFRYEPQPDERCMELRMNSYHLFGISSALAKEAGSGWRLDNSCREGYSVWAWIPELKWGMIVKQDREEILAPIENLQQRLLLGIVPLILLLLWIVHRQSKTLTAPLEVLIESVDQNRLEDHPPSRIKEVNKLSQTLQRSVSGLNEAVKKADKANQAKDEFLASMSHELRTPLTTLVGNGEILSETPLTEDQRNLLGAMDVASNNLLALINDILDLSKIDSGSFEIDYAPFDLTVLFDEVSQMFSVPAHDSGLLFEIKQQAKPTHQLWGDGKRIGQILINLLGNSIKFTEQGRVVLSSWVEDTDTLCFAVEDTGMGMSPDVLDRLFKPFEQADSSISRRYGGTGLGLYISHSLAEVMDGTIEAFSEEGKGSQFVLKLPYRESELLVHDPDKKREKATTSVLAEEFTGDVLIVEDTPELQLLERRIVESMGATVTVANNGQEAIDKVNQQDFDLILMDMQMPVMDGLEATRTLRQQGRQTPVVALTANVMQKHRDMFNEAGADAFLQKPINRVEIEQTLKKYLTLDHQRRPEEVQPVQGQTGEEEGKSFSGLNDDLSVDIGNRLYYESPPYPLLVIDDERSVLDLYEIVLGGDDRAEEPLDNLLDIVEKEQLESSEKEFMLSLADQGKDGVEMAHLALAEGHPFPLAFIDMRMPPGMNGLETAKALRKLDKRIYIVIVTAYSDLTAEEIDRELEYGVLYLQKPFSQQEIQQIARMLVKNWNKDRDLDLHTASVKREGGELPEVEEKSLNKSDSKQESSPSFTAPASAEDEVDDELMAIFRDSTVKNRKKLTAAFSSKDWAEVRGVAHTIKGSAASFGYPALSKMAETLQFAIDEEQQDQAPELTMDLLIEMGRVLS